MRRDDDGADPGLLPKLASPGDGRGLEPRASACLARVAEARSASAALCVTGGSMAALPASTKTKLTPRRRSSVRRRACSAAQAAALHAAAAALHAAATARFHRAASEMPASAALATCSRDSRRQRASASDTRTKPEVDGAGGGTPGGADAVMASAARQEGMKRGAGRRSAWPGALATASLLVTPSPAALRRALASHPATATVSSTALAATSSTAGPAAGRRLVFGSAATVAAVTLPFSPCAPRRAAWGTLLEVPNTASGARMSTLVPGLNCCAAWRTSPGLASTTSAGRTP